jgi:hypothetical protein
MLLYYGGKLVEFVYHCLREIFWGKLWCSYRWIYSFVSLPPLLDPANATSWAQHWRDRHYLFRASFRHLHYAAISWFASITFSLSSWLVNYSECFDCRHVGWQVQSLQITFNPLGVFGCSFPHAFIARRCSGFSRPFPSA